MVRRTAIFIVTNYLLRAALDNLSSLQALIKALEDLDNLCDTINEAYTESLQSDEYERWDEKS